MTTPARPDPGHRAPDGSPQGGRGPGRRRGVGVALLVVLASVAASCAAPAAAPGTGVDRSAERAAEAVPLTGSITSPGASWAVVLMGRDDGRHDLFWQLFRLIPATGRWTLDTPRGVADNGGLSIASGTDGGSLLVGFETSQDLGFSPLALTGDSGATWTQGGFDRPIVSTPASLALGSAGQAVAILDGSSPRMVIRSGGLTDWSTLISLADLQGLDGSGACTVGSLTAAAIDPTGSVLVGVACRHSDAVPILAEAGGTWHPVDLPIPAALASSVLRVMRLGRVGPAVGGLLTAEHGDHVSVMAAWVPDAAGTWSLSPPLAIGSSVVVASGSGTGSSQFVVLRRGTTSRAYVVDGPGQPWHTLPALPNGTATLAFSPAGAVSALVVHRATLTVWGLHAIGQAWSPLQTITVPIAYGSSD